MLSVIPWMVFPENDPNMPSNQAGRIDRWFERIKVREVR